MDGCIVGCEPWGASEAVNYKDHVGTSEPYHWLRGRFLSLEAKEEKTRENRRKKEIKVKVKISELKS